MITDKNVQQYPKHHNKEGTHFCLMVISVAHYVYYNMGKSIIWQLFQAIAITTSQHLLPYIHLVYQTHCLPQSLLQPPYPLICFSRKSRSIFQTKRLLSHEHRHKEKEEIDFAATNGSGGAVSHPWCTHLIKKSQSLLAAAVSRSVMEDSNIDE